MKIWHFVIGIILVGLAGLAQAATIVVTTHLDIVDNDGLCSLREAMLNAENANQSGSTDCAAGSIGGNQVVFDEALIGSTIELSGQALPTISRALELIGPVRGNPNALTISAEAASRIFVVDGADDVIIADLNLLWGRTFSADDEPGSTIFIADSGQVRLERLWIQSGIADGADNHGGAIAVFDSIVLIEDSLFQFNTAGGGGGVIFSASSKLELFATSMVLNSAVGRGGAIHAVGGDVTINASQIGSHTTTGSSSFGGALFMDGTNLVLLNTDLTGNSTLGESAHGGAVYLRDAELTMIGGRVQGNSVQGSGANGGGISTIGANVNLSGGCEILDNTTQQDSGRGGGMRIENGDLFMNNCLVSGNQTLGDSASGGGIDVRNGNATIIQSRIIANQTQGDSADGGGIRSRDGQLIMTDTLVQGNATHGDGALGGGIYHRDGDSELASVSIIGNSTMGASAHGGGLYFYGTDSTVFNSTISGNQLGAATGSAVFATRSKLDLFHVTVADNINPPGLLSHLWITGTDANPGFLTLDNSLVVNNRCGSNDFSDVTGTGNIVTHPTCPGLVVPSTNAIELGTLTNNGGPTPTHAIGQGSLAINAAGNCLATYGINTDQRGAARPGGSSSACDVGAYETDQPPAPVDLAVALTIDPPAVAVGQQVEIVIDVSNKSGTWASEVEAQVDLGSALTFQNADVGSGSYDPGTGQWKVGLLGPDEKQTLTLTVELDVSGSRLVSAAASGFQPDPIPDNNQVEGEILVAVPSATLVVNTLLDNQLDDGLCSLREAIINANNADLSGSVDCVLGGFESNIIVFHPDLVGGVIALSGQQLPTITSPLQIQGPLPGDPSGLVLDAGSGSRIFRTNTSGNVLLADLYLSKARTEGEGNPGAALLIEGGGAVQLRGVWIENSIAAQANNRGGAVAVFDSTLELEESVLTNNLSEGSGGAIFASNSEVQLEQSQLFNNAAVGRGGAIHAFDGEVTISGGLISSNMTSGSSAWGGALYMDGADLFLLDAKLSGNSTTGTDAHGGAVYLRNAELSMIGGRIDGNSAQGSGARGGGISTANNANVLLSGGCELLDNSTQQDAGWGGAVRINDGNLVMSDCLVSGNQTFGDSAHGGGIYVFNGNATITQSQIVGNQTHGDSAQGGGIRVRNGQLNMTDTLVQDNATHGASAHGGGIYHRNGDVQLQSVVVSENSAVGGFARGGGGYAEESALGMMASSVVDNETTAIGGGFHIRNSTFLIDESTVAENQSGAIGGGLHVLSSSGQVTNTTFSGNSTPTQTGAAGSGLYVDRSQVDLVHVTVANNSGSLGRGLFSNGSVDEPAQVNLVNSLFVANNCTSFNSSLITANAGTLSTEAGCDAQVVPIGQINMGPLADNGGPTLTHALSPGSVAIGAAGNCEADWDVTTDQRGLPRPGGNTSACDAGAFEFQGELSVADLGVTMGASSEIAMLGHQVNFSIVVSQAGPDAASGVAAQIDWPAGFSYSSSGSAVGSFDSSNGLWSIGELNAGQTASMSLSLLAVEAGEQIVNVEVSAQELDPDNSNNGASVSVNLFPEPEPMMVTTLADEVLDDGACSLREAIINVNNADQSGSIDCAPGSPFFNEIYFDPALAGGTLQLAGQALPVIGDNLSIFGPLPEQADGLVIDGNQLSRLIHLSGSRGVVLTGMTLTGGRVGPGESGGAAVLVENDSFLDLRHVRVLDNHAEGAAGHGGALKVIDSGVSLRDCELSNNSSAAGHGGAIYARVDSDELIRAGFLSLERCLLADNQSGSFGGAIYAERVDVRLENSTLSGNESEQAGGGLFIDTGQVFLFHASLVDNRADTGAQDLVVIATDRGVEFEAGRIEASLIVQSEAGVSSCSFPSDAQVYVRSSLATDAACQVGLISATAAALGPLADNGGPTRTHALEEGSAAIDFVDLCEGGGPRGDNGGSGLIDQRGLPRPGAGSMACDAGAYERQDQPSDRIFHNRFEVGAGSILRDCADCPDLVVIPAGSFTANALGLFDTHGNVREWTRDCGNSDYVGAPTDCSHWLEGNCGQAAMRGGSWFNGGGDQRSARRFNLGHDQDTNNTTGFRVARDFSG